MTRPLRSARWIALVAAYAIGLQALLPVALSIAGPAGFPICSGASGLAGGTTPEDDGKTGSRDCCAVLCCGPALATPPQSPVLALRPQPIVVASALAPDAFALPIVRGPQSPRAPPRG
ncbi:MAG: DUF2946 family protein [Pseudolabrys sp.]